jgi:hypothetical protein
MEKGGKWPTGAEMQAMRATVKMYWSRPTRDTIFLFFYGIAKKYLCKIVGYNRLPRLGHGSWM